MGFKDLYFPLGFIVSVSAIITLRVQNAIRPKKENAVWTFSTGEYVFNLKHQHMFVLCESPLHRILVTTN